MKYLPYLFVALLLFAACAKETTPEPTAKVVPPIVPKDTTPIAKTDSLTAADTCKITVDEYPTWFIEGGFFVYFSIVVPKCNCAGNEFTYEPIGNSGIWYQSPAGIPDTFEVNYGDYFCLNQNSSDCYKPKPADWFADFKITHVASGAVLVDSVKIRMDNSNARPDLHN